MGGFGANCRALFNFAFSRVQVLVADVDAVWLSSPLKYVYTSAVDLFLASAAAEPNATGEFEVRAGLVRQYCI